MTSAVFLILEFDHHVINIDLHCLANLLLEHIIDSGSCILQPKRYHFVTVDPQACYELYLFLFFGLHPDLIVP